MKAVHGLGRHREPVSRRGHVFTNFGIPRNGNLARIRARDAVLHGEIVWPRAYGRFRFYDLLFRRDWPYFCAFDVLAVDGEDLRGRPLVERRRRLRAIMPRVDHVDARTVALFRRACRSDLEGIVGKGAQSAYHADGVQTSWLKIKNPDYSQIAGRREVFEHRSDPFAAEVVVCAGLGVKARACTTSAGCR